MAAEANRKLRPQRGEYGHRVFQRIGDACTNLIFQALDGRSQASLARTGWGMRERLLTGGAQRDTILLQGQEVTAEMRQMLPIRMKAKSQSSLVLLDPGPLVFDYLRDWGRKQPGFNHICIVHTDARADEVFDYHMLTAASICFVPPAANPQPELRAFCEANIAPIYIELSPRTWAEGTPLPNLDRLEYLDLCLSDDVMDRATQLLRDCPLKELRLQLTPCTPQVVDFVKLFQKTLKKLVVDAYVPPVVMGHWPFLEELSVGSSTVQGLSLKNLRNLKRLTVSQAVENPEWENRHITDNELEDWFWGALDYNPGPDEPRCQIQVGRQSFVKHSRLSHPLPVIEESF